MDHWKKTEEYSESTQSEYSAQMAKDLKGKVNKANIFARPVSSAQARYDNRHNDPAAYEAYLNREMVTAEKAQVRDENGDVFVNERKVTAKEVLVEKSIRDSRGNTLGDAMSTDAGFSATREKKETAENAFTYSPPMSATQRDVLRLINLVEITNKLIELEPPKESFWNRLKKKVGLQSTRHDIDKSSDAYALFRMMGGKDEDFNK